jgi:hypothetical protein
VDRRLLSCPAAANAPVAKAARAPAPTGVGAFYAFQHRTNMVALTVFVIRTHLRRTSKLEEQAIPNLFHLVTSNKLTIDGRRWTMQIARTVRFWLSIDSLISSIVGRRLSYVYTSHDAYQGGHLN